MTRGAVATHRARVHCRMSLVPRAAAADFAANGARSEETKTEGEDGEGGPNSCEPINATWEGQGHAMDVPCKEAGEGTVEAGQKAM
jgi:hypothetical protein